jgi:hypothetical protein
LRGSGKIIHCAVREAGGQKMGGLYIRDIIKCMKKWLTFIYIAHFGIGGGIYYTWKLGGAGDAGC